MTLKTGVTIAGWIPYQLKHQHNQYTCNWLYTQHLEYKEPFFTETMHISKGHIYNSGAIRAQSELSVFADWAETIDAVKPTAFIFHISRCGSTLLSQALGLKDEHIVLSEVPFIDELLLQSEQENWPAALDIKKILKAAFVFYGQNNSGTKKHLFVKTDSWHIYFLELLREIYPAAPFILLYRRPDEVIRSQQKKRGIQAVPGLVPDHILGIAPLKDFSLDQHMANVIESYLTSFKRVARHDQLTLLVNYNEGIENISRRVASFCGIKMEDADLDEIIRRGQFDAKHPGIVFNEESIKTEVPAYLRASFDAYEELEQLRKI